MDSSSLINAVSNPGQYATNPLEEDQQGIQDTSLSAQGVTSNPALENFMQMMQGNNMSSSTNFGGAGTEGGAVDFGNISTSPNPYTGAYNPVTDNRVVAPQTPGYNPSTGTYRTLPDAGVTGGQNFDAWGNSVSNLSSYNPFSYTPEASTQSQRGMFSSANDGRTDVGFGMSYNMDALSNAFNPSTAGSWKNKGQSLFDFGDTNIAGGLGFGKEYGAGMNAINKIGQFGNLTRDGDLVGKARDARRAMGMFGMTGNRAWDMGTKGTALEYINDPLSTRSMLGAVVNKAGFGYGGLTMTGLDYLQGYNPNTGSLIRSGAYALNPLVGGIGDMFKVWDNIGDKAGSFTDEKISGNNVQTSKYAQQAQSLEELNKGYYSKYGSGFGLNPADTQAADYLSSKGLEPGTHQYDMAVQSYNMAMNKNNTAGKGFRDNMAKTRAQTSAVGEMDKIVVEGQRVEAQRVAEEEAQRQYGVAQAATQQEIANYNRQNEAAAERLSNSTYDAPYDFGSDNFSGDGGTDSTGATADDYSSYDNPDESSGPSDSDWGW